MGVVDCVDDEEERRFAGYFEPIHDPGDLFQIAMELSRLYETIDARNVNGIRISLLSFASLLEYSTLRDVSRFVHMLTGRVIATGDLGVFPVDTTAVDHRIVDLIENFCEATIEVRTSEGCLEVRVDGLDDQPGTWQAISSSHTE